MLATSKNVLFPGHVLNVFIDIQTSKELTQMDTDNGPISWS